MNITKDRSISLLITCGDTTSLLTVFYHNPRSFPWSPTGVVAGVGGGEVFCRLMTGLGFL